MKQSNDERVLVHFYLNYEWRALFTGGICDKILKIRYSIFVPESKRHFAVASAVYHNIRVVYYVVHEMYVFEVAKRRLREDFWLDS